MVDTMMVYSENCESPEWRQEDDGRAKRHRSNRLSARADDDTCKTRRDCFDLVLEGYVSGQIRNSWLNQVRKIRKGSYISDHHEGQASLESLSLQLLQVKRRLWPASERCAHACRTAPYAQFEEARRNCNPMEPLGEGRHHGLNQMFMNRSAIKLANMDAMLDFSLTKTGTEDFLFADLCGAPGGFSEYLMKRCQATRYAGSCRGYGMSLIGANGHGDGTRWKLDMMQVHHGVFQSHFRVSGGDDGTGDLYNWENVRAFRKEIESDILAAGLPSQKVHLVVADGGFVAQRNSECQEEIAQKLVVCQIAAGLHLLAEGGTLIVKMFGFQTATVRTAMRYLFERFEGIMAVKPVSSRPASAERYVICTGYRGVPADWDGQKWMNQIFDVAQNPNADADYWSLDRYLNDFDRDMLSLNLRACFAILSYLDGKTATGRSGLWERPRVDVNAYQEAWKLY